MIFYLFKYGLRFLKIYKIKEENISKFRYLAKELGYDISNMTNNAVIKKVKEFNQKASKVGIDAAKASEILRKVITKDD